MRKTGSPHESTAPDPLADFGIRNAVRFPIKLEAIVHAMEGDLQAVTINISNTGVLFAVDQAVRVGQQLEFTLFLSTDSESQKNGQIHCKGKVVRCEAKRWRFVAAATIEDYEFGTHDVLFW
jgi:hypothetical protein